MKNNRFFLFGLLTLVLGSSLVVYAFEDKDFHDSDTTQSSTQNSKYARPAKKLETEDLTQKRKNSVSVKSSNSGKETKCEMTFNLKATSVFYKWGKGSGNITCDNGQGSDIFIKVNGGGITFGQTKILNGHGSFSKVNDISNLFGSYASAGAHAGAGGSAGAQAMTKGKVSMSLTGTGKGVNIGFDFGRFKIMPK
ncbi:MAG TPA: hypothetical protein DDW49_10290 [Deltaproteobacteria bacterium]|nr:MAG: hypothetical protein A2048_08120 [Deltaproteobacteria bacterium GWA2_45_12]HBF13751.1 hypothetical protein [Deltaproteobacteria bacterium]